MTNRVVQKFYAPWCAPCKAVQPLLEKVAAEFNAEIIEVNIEEQPEVARAMDIRSIPTIVLYEDDHMKVKRPGIGSITPVNLNEVFVAAYGDK